LNVQNISFHNLSEAGSNIKHYGSFTVSPEKTAAGSAITKAMASIHTCVMGMLLV
jgi:hypothetical protein